MFTQGGAVLALSGLVTGVQRREHRDGAEGRAAMVHVRIAPPRRRPVGHGPAPLVVSPIYRTLIDVRDDVISLACATFPAHPQVALAAAEVIGHIGARPAVALSTLVP